MPQVDDFGNWVTPNYLKAAQAGLEPNQTAAPPNPVYTQDTSGNWQQQPYASPPITGTGSPAWTPTADTTLAPVASAYSPYAPAFDASGAATGSYSAPAASGPAAASSVAAPASGTSPGWEKMQEYLLNSPFYKQGMESLNRNYDASTKHASEMLALQDQAALREQDRAKHDWLLRQKQIRESLASRGLLSSGQTGFELGQGQYSYDNVLQDIAAAGEARQKQGAYDQSTAERQVASDRYTLLTNTASYYKDLWWDPNTGAYVGPTS